MENKLKREEYGISMNYGEIKPSSTIEIASEDNPNEKVWILWKCLVAFYVVTLPF